MDVCQALCVIYMSRHLITTGDTRRIKTNLVLYLDNLESSAIPIVHNHDCNGCVSGAVCDIHVKALDNYWGYQKNKDELAFILGQH